MNQFVIGDFVTIPLKTREVLGLVVEVDNCDGRCKGNPWVVINSLDGSTHATARNLKTMGVKKFATKKSELERKRPGRARRTI